MKRITQIKLMFSVAIISHTFKVPLESLRDEKHKFLMSSGTSKAQHTHLSVPKTSC
ncbi:hypothetical protein X975_05918, partial [Stegodyphus mimosarum]